MVTEGGCMHVCVHVWVCVCGTELTPDKAEGRGRDPRGLECPSCGILPRDSPLPLHPCLWQDL